MEESFDEIIDEMSYWYQKFVDRMLADKTVVEEIAHNGDRPKYQDFGNFITVSRDPGSGGNPVAKLVAKKLGFTFYNKKLINEIARSANARRQILEEVDEKTRTQMDDLVHNVLNPEYISERRYIKHLCKVILSLAQKGNVVILGRGSNFITPRSKGLHVRVTAPYRVCVARAVQYEHVTYQRAREIIGKVMAERAGFVKQYFGKDIVNPKYYDLTITTTYLSIENTAQMIVNAYKRKFS